MLSISTDVGGSVRNDKRSLEPFLKFLVDCTDLVAPLKLALQDAIFWNYCTISYNF